MHQSLPLASLLKRQLLHAFKVLLQPSKRLRKVLNDIIDMLDTDRDTDQIGGDAGRLLFSGVELLVGCRRGVDNKGPRNSC